MIYTTFAELYDELMDSEMYHRWVQYFKQRVCLDGGPVLDLGCGSAALTLLLKQAGYQMEGLDLSEEMLSLASEKMIGNESFIPLYQGDMTDLRALGKYNAVVSTLDSLCYLADESELQLVFEQVYDHLISSGHFLFDVHSLYQVDEVFPDYMYNYQDENEAFLWHSYPTDVEHAVEHELTFFVREQETGSYQRLSEYHYERTYPLDVYVKLLKKAGFDRIDVSADFGQSSVKKNSVRWFFSCTK